MKEAFITDSKDNVATSFEDIDKSENINIFNLSTGEHLTIESKNPIPYGNKVALKDIKKGEKITKYGYTIGKAIRDISQGEVVHVMNIDSIYAPIPDSVRKSVLNEYHRRYGDE